MARRWVKWAIGVVRYAAEYFIIDGPMPERIGRFRVLDTLIAMDNEVS